MGYEIPDLASPSILSGVGRLISAPALAAQPLLKWSGEPNRKPEWAADLEQQFPVFEDATTRFEALRQARLAGNIARDWLNSQGFFKASVIEEVSDDSTLRAQLTINQGPTFTLGRLSITPQPPNLSLTLRSGQRAYPAQIQQQHDALIEQLRRAGYSQAATGRLRVTGDAELATVDIDYEVVPGPLTRLDQVIFAPDFPMTASARQHLVPFPPGTQYHPDRLAEVERRLGELQVFSLYSADLSAPSSSGDRNVIVQAQARKRYTLATGLSFASDQGLGLNADFTTRNLSQRGDSLVISPQLSDNDRSLSTTWNYPNAFGYGYNLGISGAVEAERTDAFRRDAGVFTTTLDITQTPTLIYSVGVGFETSRESDAEGTRNLIVSSLHGSISRDQTDDLLDPTRGWRASIRLEPGQISGDTQAGYVSSTVEGRIYRPLTRSAAWVLAARARAGWIGAPSDVSLPASRRFFAGGGGSARGYAFQSVGPKGPTGVPSGGRQLIETSAEIRWRATDSLGAVGFVDAAEVTGVDQDVGNRLRLSTGVGLRYFTAIGPIRFDVGVPLDRTPTDDAFQVYFSIGQAF